MQYFEVGVRVKVQARMDRSLIRKGQEGDYMTNEELTQLILSLVKVVNELDKKQLENETEIAYLKSENYCLRNRVKKLEHIVETNFLDLPSEIIEKILSYLPDKEICGNIRNVCQRLRNIADGYVHIGK